MNISNIDYIVFDLAIPILFALSGVYFYTTFCFKFFEGEERIVAICLGIVNLSLLIIGLKVVLML